MAEYIDREALEVDLNHRLSFLMAENGEYDSYTNGFDECVDRVENFPDADVVPVKHGRWEEHCGIVRYKHTNIPVFMCSVCGDYFCDIVSKHADFYHYCPNCGAKMDGDMNETD